MNKVTLQRAGISISIEHDDNVIEDDLVEVVQDSLKAVTGFHYTVTKD